MLRIHLVNHAITWGVSVGELTAKSRDKLSADEKARIVHAKRMARRTIKQDEALDKLFSDVAPRFKGRPGGYTRLLKTRVRAGDAAPMAFVELVVRATEAPAAEPPAAKGKGKAALAEAAGTEAAPAQANKPRKTSAKKAESKEE